MTDLPEENGKPPSPLVLGERWYEDRFGGLNRYVADLFTAYVELGGRPNAVVVGPGIGAPDGFNIAGNQSLPLVCRIVKFARVAASSSSRAQLVDAHFALYAFIPVVVGKLKRFPLVVHFHGPWASESRSALGDPRWLTCAKKQIEVSVYRRAQHIVTLSGAFKRVLVEQYGQVPWKIEVVPPGITLERFQPGDQVEARSSLNLPADAYVVVAVRRLVPRMGFDVLIRAWTRVSAALPIAVLVIVGEGPERAKLQELARTQEISTSVRFLGKVDDSTLIAAYRAADVAVVPTVELEGFGLIVLEALACGTPVVATDVGGLPEALAPLDSGLVVPPGDPVALADRLESALTGTSPLPTRDQCRKYSETFSWERCALEHASIYSRAVNPGGRKLRVVFVDHCAQLSGGEIALLRLLQALDQVEAHVILAEDGPLTKELVRAGISAEVLPMHEQARGLKKERLRPGTVSLMTAFHSVAYCLTLARRLRRLKPDIVHTNSLKAGIYGSAAARLARIPSVWHLRDRIADDYLPAPAVRLVRVWARFMPSGLIANSEATLASVKSSVSNAVIPSPVSASTLNHSYRRSLGHEGELRVGIVGRICPWKGQDVFLRGFASAFPQGNARAIVVGAALFGEEEYDQGLRQLAQSLGIEDRVDFRGFRHDVNAELAQFDILVHASTSPEPFGLVVVEGMAAGLPVVASDGGGPAEVITQGVNGLLYPPGDDQALAGILMDLATDSDLRQRLGKAAVARSRDFSPDSVAPRIMSFYREVLGDRWPQDVPEL